MNKAELIDAISQHSGETKSSVGRILDSIAATVGETLQKGDEVVLVGFGTFKTADRAAKVGRNPMNGEQVTIPARRVAVFKPGKGLRDKVA